MAAIRAFRGWRYDLAQVGPLADITAPATCINDDTRRALYERHPCNIVRVMSNRPEPGDENESIRFERAADFLRHWQSAGVLERDHEETLFVYHVEYGAADARTVRRGILCRLRLDSVSECPEADKSEIAAALHTLQATQTFVVPTLCSTPELPEILTAVESAAYTQTPLQCNAEDGSIHRVWPVTNLNALHETAALLDAANVSVDGNAEQFAAALQLHKATGDSPQDCLALIVDRPDFETIPALAGIVLCEMND